VIMSVSKGILLEAHPDFKLGRRIPCPTSFPVRTSEGSIVRISREKATKAGTREPRDSS
jgi:hypothetical protein